MCLHSLHFIGEFYSLENALKVASMNFHNPTSKVLYTHFTDRKTWPQSSWVTCPRLTELVKVHSLHLGPGSCEDLEKVGPLTDWTPMMSKEGVNLWEKKYSRSGAGGMFQ